MTKLETGTMLIDGQVFAEGVSIEFDEVVDLQDVETLEGLKGFYPGSGEVSGTFTVNLHRRASGHLGESHAKTALRRYQRAGVGADQAGAMLGRWYCDDRQMVFRGPEAHHAFCSAGGWPCPIGCEKWPT